MRSLQVLFLPNIGAQPDVLHTTLRLYSVEAAEQCVLGSLLGLAVRHLVENTQKKLVRRVLLEHLPQRLAVFLLLTAVTDSLGHGLP